MTDKQRIIEQCHVSKSISDFPFHEIYSLDDYKDYKLPCVFFGCYRYEDLVLINHHQGLKYVFWTGQDILTVIKNNWPVYDAKHFTAHPKVYELLLQNFDDVTLVKPASFLNQANPQVLGNKIYAYCPSSVPRYHGSDIIDELRRGGYEIIIGDGQWTQDQWRHGKADEFYKDIFIGLCLSEFAGGGTSIIEMGLRGVRVVTNVFRLPNTISFTDAQSVAKIIEEEKGKVGNTYNGLSESVWNSLDHNFEWLK